MGEESERDTEMFNQVPISIQVFGEYKIYSKIQRKKNDDTNTHELTIPTKSVIWFA